MHSCGIQNRTKENEKAQHVTTYPMEKEKQNRRFLYHIINMEKADMKKRSHSKVILR